jgi:hypothetical protein
MNRLKKLMKKNETLLDYSDYEKIVTDLNNIKLYIIIKKELRG